MIYKRLLLGVVLEHHGIDYIWISLLNSGDSCENREHGFSTSCI